MRKFILPQFERELAAYGRNPPRPTPDELRAIIAEFRLAVDSQEADRRVVGRGDQLVSTTAEQQPSRQPKAPNADATPQFSTAPNRVLADALSPKRHPLLLPTVAAATIVAIAGAIFLVTSRQDKSGGSQAEASVSAGPHVSGASPSTPLPLQLASKYYSVEVITAPDRFLPGNTQKSVGCSNAFLFPRGKLATVPVPEDRYTATWLRWGQQHGGIHLGNMNLAFSIAANEDTTVQVLGGEVIAETVPVSGGDVASCKEGGPPGTSFLALDLDAKLTTYYYPSPPASQEDIEKLVPVPFLLNVEPNKPEVVIVNAKTVKCNCAWYLNLFLIVGADKTTYRVDDNGKPFVTVAYPNKGSVDEYGYQPGGGKWCKLPCDPT